MSNDAPSLDEAITGRRKRRRKELSTESTAAAAPAEKEALSVTQEVTETPTVIVRGTPPAKEKPLSPRTIAEIERGRRALQEHKNNRR